MKPTSDQKFLVATLFNGYSYKEVRDSKTPKKNPNSKYPAQKQVFAKQVIVFELRGFGLQRTDESFFKDSYQVLNISQLSSARDSLSAALDEQSASFSRNISRNSLMRNENWLTRRDGVKTKQNLHIDSIFDTLSRAHKRSSIQHALEYARSSKSYITSTKDEFFYKKKYIARHRVEWNRKFTLSFACFVFFFIGAPLGAIIRKGGLGMPVVISVLFFIVYYIITITGEKFAKELVWDAAMGMWVSSFILLPLGVFLSYKATNDSSIMNADFYVEAIKKLVRLKNNILAKIKDNKK
jgi:lipopolysaccharide export system permease protein